MGVGLNPLFFLLVHVWFGGLKKRHQRVGWQRLKRRHKKRVLEAHGGEAWRKGQTRAWAVTFGQLQARTPRAAATHVRVRKARHPRPFGVERRKNKTAETRTVVCPRIANTKEQLLAPKRLPESAPPRLSRETCGRCPSWVLSRYSPRRRTVNASAT